MVYFWQRQQRSVQASIIPKSLSSPTQLSQPLPPLAAAALSTFSRGAGQVTQLQKIQAGSTGIGSTSHNIISSGSGSYNHTNKIQHISPSYMLDKLSEYSRRKQESDRRRVAERELENLNMKIDKLLLKMGDAETHNQSRLRLEDECVVCLAAPATMQTFPCGHKVVCRKCLIKTIQVAVSQRCLPLRCVICRERILTLHHTVQVDDSTCGATVLQTSALPSALIPPFLESSLPVSPSATPTSPMGFFSFITGSRIQSSSLRLVSPAGPALQGTQSPTPFAETVDKSQKTMPLIHVSPEEEFIRYAPTDIEAFVNSHNDALNLHKTAKPNENKVALKHNKHGGVTSSKRNETVSHTFVHCQPVKIHPVATDHMSSFMDCPRPDSAVLSTFGSNNLHQKPVGASKLLAKFLPPKSKRKCNWFRQEN